MLNLTNKIFGLCLCEFAYFRAKIKRQSIGNGVGVGDGRVHVLGGGCSLANGGIGQCFRCPGCPGSVGTFDGCPSGYICGGCKF